MELFTKKLELIYKKLFNEDMNKLTEAFIDYKKFKPEKNSEEEFFLNRKIVLRRWLIKGMKCTSDFQKSFNQYKISHYLLGSSKLFQLDDFKESLSLDIFEKKIDAYLQQKRRIHVDTAYKYIYFFNELKEKIESYKIREWNKGEGEESEIELESNLEVYRGTFTFHDESNIFITLKIEDIRYYLLFHDNGLKYLVGTSMGYLPTDKQVPYAQKVVLSKERLEQEDIELQFILNEVETITALENRFNPQMQELKISPFIRYNTQFRKYHRLFSRLLSMKFQQYFYYRLAFREFYALKRLFERVSKEESYFIFNYYRAILELIKTLEMIKDKPLYMVMEYRDEMLFTESNYKIRKIKDRLFNLSSYGISITIIFVIDSLEILPDKLLSIIEEIKTHNIELRLVEKKVIIHDVNSLDFLFTKIGDERDFVFADPLRDSKDVYKIFIDKITMDEYIMDYERIFEQSIIA